MFFLLFILTPALATETKTIAEALQLPEARTHSSEKIVENINTYVDLFYVGQGLLKDFDAELDRAKTQPQASIFSSETYHDLLAVRTQQLDLLHTIEQQYMSMQKSGLKEKILEVHRFFSQQNKFDKLASLDVRESLAQAQNKILPAISTVRKLLTFTDHPKTKNYKRSRYFSSFDHGLLYSKMVSTFNGPFMPSAGKEGNITGETFPEKTWALTFDDGPSLYYTPKVLENLAQFHEKITFFWVAENVLRFPQMVAQAKAANMPLANHSFTHPKSLSKVTEKELIKEVVESTAVDTKAYGEAPRFFRLPGGNGVADPKVRELIASQNLIHVLWNVDSLDWADKNPISILERVKKEMQIEKGGVILFHDIHPQSVEASKMLLEYAASKKGTPEEMHFVTLPEFVNGKVEKPKGEMPPIP